MPTSTRRSSIWRCLPRSLATHNLNVSYLAFRREQRLFCRSRVLSVRRSVAVAEGEVTSVAGDLIAKAVGTFGVRRLD